MSKASARQRILLFDSGLGGLTVFAAVRAARPDADYTYIADDAGFPYGALTPEALNARVMMLMEVAVATHKPDLVIIACNTAATMMLPNLRAKFGVPFVGVVPAIKPAAQLTKSGMVSVLATKGTVSRDYTRDLIQEHAAHVAVNLVGSPKLADLAERKLRGESLDDAEIKAEITPCFLDVEAKKTDVIVLGCTHYPLLLSEISRLAPWPVQYIDPAPAIARRVVQLLGAGEASQQPQPFARMIFTSGAIAQGALAKNLAAYGLHQS